MRIDRRRLRALDDFAVWAFARRLPAHRLRSFLHRIYRRAGFPPEDVLVLVRKPRAYLEEVFVGEILDPMPVRRSAR